MLPFKHEDRLRKIQEIDFSKRRNKKISDIDYKKDYMNINSINLDLSETIYRIYNFEHFIKDLRDNRLTLMNPSVWEDPFENYLLRSTGIYKEIDVSFEDISNSYYALCWSLREESDGLWRNYKGEKEFAIKVKTTAGKLFNEIYDINDDSHYVKHFIGKVNYVMAQKIIDVFNEKIDILGVSSGIEFAETLFVKRTAFDYEEEIRIVIYNSENHDKLLRIQTNYDSWVEEIIFDPWVKDDIFENAKQQIQNAGFNGKISKSSLYDQLNFKVRI